MLKKVLITIFIVLVFGQVMRHFAKSSTTPAPIAAAATTISYWAESVDESPMDGKTTVVLTRTSLIPYNAWLGTYIPQLTVQCYSKGKPSVLVDIKAAPSVESGDDLHSVRIKFDDGKPFSQRWSESKDQKALFASSPSSLIADMLKHDSLMFEFDPFNTTSQTTVLFTIDGLRESMAKHPECSAK